MAQENVFRVMLRMEIKPGLDKEFERVWCEVGDSVVTHPANLGQWLSHSEDEGVYYIVSDWVSEERFREFETSDRHLRHREKLHPYRSGGWMTTMNVVTFLPGVASVGTTHQDWESAR
ncbi:heme-degrading monooxygenase HmoA [Tamaricihabitans halophyticus]|uniref:Heme-degrading monooxygenase HmoA n=1 Tax=Tamaricihabitans halophyticus TaxID=1262583 RepID=A0A4R2R4S9_9PSEU|nr:antibiotic biosynthesis monooxygenase family protein [Tamaricihabitans halophyticus]TCP56789.1 heme-degrading monooxygenase HmoA [Tamaricihabitans halophyticus]